MTVTKTRLAVILHADIVASTTLVQTNAQLAHQRIQGCFKRSSKIVRGSNGRTRELRGDALVAEFPRASDALLAALHMQKENTDYLASLDETSDGSALVRPELRIGIALGEVVIANGTITGDGVVLAQRLEQLAEPGGVCVQGSIYEAAPRQLPIEFANLGEQTLKGFPEPILAFAASVKSAQQLPAIDTKGQWRRMLVFGAAAVLLIILVLALAQRYSMPVNLTGDDNNSTQSAISNPDASNSNNPLSKIDTEKSSIAVLAFKNVGGNTDEDYFANGIAEDIITDLSRFSGLSVIARSSSFGYQTQSMPLATIGSELGVGYLLDGSVWRSDSRIRINAQLIEIESGSEIWSERYDREISDVFEIQQEVTSLIVNALSVELDATEKAELRNVNRVSIDAYDVFLRGLEKHSEFNRDANIEARDYFHKAIRLDNSYARAYATIALSHAIDVNMNWSADRKRSIEAGLENVNKALELDEVLPNAYFAQGSLFLSSGQHSSAVAMAKRGIELAPNYADGFAQLAFYLTNAGKHERSLESMAEAKRLNPRFTLPYLYVESMALFQLRRYDEVIKLLEDGIERNPEYDRAHLIMAASYAYIGQQEDAEWSVEEALAVRADISIADETMDTVLKRSEDIDHYIDGLRLAGLQ